MTTRLRVGAADLLFVEHPLYADAHPGEACDPAERCVRCAIARRPDTHELVLLWLAGDIDWTVSRADPEWARHRRDFAAPTPTGATP